MPFEHPDPDNPALLVEQDEEIYQLPSSFAQERLWFLDRFEPESPLFNIPAAFHLRGKVDARALNRALSQLAVRHETLRTTFLMEEGRLWQVVSPADPQMLQRVDASDLPAQRRRPALQRLARREAGTPFDLAHGPLFRATLVDLGGGEHAFFLTLHHSIADGASMMVLYRELEKLYGAHRSGTAADLPELPIQYADFADWQRQHLRGEVLETKMAYWRDVLEGAPELLELPTDHPRPSVRTHRGAQVVRQLPAGWGRRIAGLGTRGATPFMVLLAAYQTLLSHHSGSDDLVVGTAVANRPTPQVEGLIGLFANTLPLRVSTTGNPSFRELVVRARDVTLDAFENQDVPFERLVEELAPGRNPSHPPLLQVMFLYDERRGDSPLSLPGLEVTEVPVATGTAKYDLAVTASHKEGRLSLRADYSRDLFDASTIERLLAGYETLLGAALDDPDTGVAELSPLTAGQRHQILHAWNDTAPAPERRRRLAERRLHTGFEERAAEHPDAVAVATAGNELTYGELDRRANLLAHRLRAAGVGPGSLVGVHLERTPRMVEAVLAVHKAGGAYVPLEINWPERRVRWIIENRGLAVVVAEDGTREHLAAVETPLAVVSLDAPGGADGAGGEASRAAAPPPDAGSGPDDPAYIIFTSGSTGHPKGVVVRHRPAVNLVEWVNETFAVGPGDRILFVTSLAFDLSVYDVFGILAAGATIRLADAGEVLDPQRLVRILRDEPITFWDSAPAALQRCVPYFPQVGEAAGPGDDLRLVFLSGDWIPLSLPVDLAETFPGVQVVSLGGATEATIWSNFFPLGFPIGEIDPEWSSIPYGRPITGARYHVLNDRLAPCPVGVPGDLFIAGEVLSTGYAGTARQTAPAYVPDPFAAAAGGKPGGRLYRTGDRARYFPDGNLEFLGRLDTQVKVRGYRIELGEIEAVLCEHPATREVVVLAREDTPGNQRLVAYYEPRDAAHPPPEDELRELAEEELPAYMLPAAYVRLDRWPVSPTGKLDRKALPSPEEVARAREAEQAREEAVAAEEAARAASDGTGEDPTAADTAVPSTRPQAERAIAALWARLLEVDEVDPHTGFFDQGGNSLLLARVHVELQELFGRDIPMVTLFRRTTVAELAEELAPAGSSAEDEVAVAVAEEEAATEDTTSSHVAVIGMAGRFPSAADVGELWNLLSEGRDGIRFFSDQELLEAGVDPARLDDDHYVKGRGALADPELFDADFFGLSPRDAQILDPQQRLFLEVAWHALEDAGQASSGNGNRPRVGVFAGASDNDYRRELLDRPEVVAAVGRFQVVLGNQLDYVATRLAYKLDLTGPAMTVQTACSTSLVAVHLAARSLVDGECDLAVAGGASVQAREVSGYPFLDGGIDSPDGRTRAFDADAAGTVGGSGVGAVVLKRLDDALANGDPVRAVIRGSAVNNDGGAKMTFTSPSANGQAAVIRAAQRAAGVEPSSVGYVEAHGTATPMGDPIEIDGLKRAWKDGGEVGEGCCLVGTIKSNLGHLDAAAGVAGLIKTVLALEHGEIPPSLHFRTPNPELEIDGSGFRIAAERTPWPTNGTPRRAGVSSFGIGGTNAHVVVEEAPQRQSAAAEPPRPAQLLRLSARTPAALERAVANLADHLRRTADAGRNGPYLADVAYTLDVGRRAFPHRAAVVARGPAEAVAALADGRPLTGTAGEPPPVVFVFPGQGAQYPGMGGDLYAEEPVFRDAVDQCCDLLEPYLGFDLRTVLYPLDGEDDDAAARLRRTDVAQPALLTCEYALSELLRSWGIEPAAVAGHSIGEYTAALVAGVFTLPDALALVAERGRLMAGLPAGAMLAVRRPEGEVAAWLEDHPEVELATVNAPDSVVVSGPGEAVDAFAAWLEERFGDGDGAVETTRLHTSHAFHSAMMDPILDPFLDEVAEAAPMAPRIPIASNSTGTWLTDEEATDPAYWARHLRGAVRFADNLETLLSDGPRAVVEVGPGRALSTFTRRHPRAGEAVAIARTLPHPREDRGDLDLLLEAVGRLWVAGVDADPKAFWESGRRRVSLPGYPFQRRRFWFDGVEAPPAPEDTGAGENGGDGFESPTEEAVAAAWEDLLGVAGVGRRDDFFELGGSSLAGLGLASRLERDHGASLPGSFLLEAPTVAQQAELIDTLTAGGEAPAASCRVRLQAGSPGRPPLFMVHQVGGHVFTFRALGRELGDDQPLFGLRSRGLEAGEEAFTDLEAMAEHYLELLREEQPRGPVLLGGASMGGMVAWEMARRLVEDGEPPALLTLMDTPCGDQMPAREANAEPVSFVLAESVGTTPRELVKRIGLELSELRTLPFAERWERALAALEEDERDGLDEATLAQARRRARVLGANVDALYAYEPQPLPLRLLYFRAAERREADPARPELPWIELARGGCETVITAGNHETMHEAPAVEGMAGELRRRLDLAADSRARKLWQGARR